MGLVNFIKNIFIKTPVVVDPSKAKRILAIDDDLVQRTMIVKTLGKHGYLVLTSGDGQDGLEMAFQQKPDLIILDVLLPGLKGNEVCRRLKDDPGTRNIPIIFLTSQDSPQEVFEHYDLGADIHLTKPINAKELLFQVRASLEEN